MKPHDTNLECLIRETLKEDSEIISIPPSEHTWEKILSTQKPAEDIRKPFYRRLYTPKAVACLIVIVLSVGLFMSNQPAIAINNKIIKTVVDFFSSPETSGVVSVSMSSNPSPTPDMPPPPPDWPLDTEETVMTLDQAQIKASFDFKMPSYLPKGISLDIITVLHGYRVRQYYRSDKNRLIIEQHHVPEGFASSHTFNSSRVKKVKINGIEGTLIIQNNPYTGQNQIHILWCEDSIKFRIETDLSKKAALNIARSIE